MSSLAAAGCWAGGHLASGIKKVSPVGDIAKSCKILTRILKSYKNH